MPLPSWQEIQRSKATVPVLLVIIAAALALGISSMRGSGAPKMDSPADHYARDLTTLLHSDSRFAHLECTVSPTEASVVIVRGELLSQVDRAAFEEFLAAAKPPEEVTIRAEVAASAKP